jgi:hypothetical protein
MEMISADKVEDPDNFMRIVEGMERQSTERIDCGTTLIQVDRYKTQSGEQAVRIRSFVPKSENSAGLYVETKLQADHRLYLQE